MRVYFTWELNRLNMRRDVPQIKVNEPSVTDQDVEKIIGSLPAASNDSATNVNGAGVGRKSSVVTCLGNNVTTSIATEDKKSSSSPNNKNSSTLPSPKAPPRSKSKDKDRDRDKDNSKPEESAKLLQDSVGSETKGKDGCGGGQQDKKA